MNLLYVVAKAEYFLSHRLDLAMAAKKSGFNVAVATTKFSSDNYNLQKLKGINDFFVRFNRASLNPFIELLSIFDLIKVFRKFRPKIIHNVALKPTLYGAAIARFYGLPSVNSINGFGYIFTSNHVKARILKPFVKLALRVVLNHKSVSVIVQNSADYDDCLVLLPKCSLHLIAGSGVDTENFYPKHYDGIFTFTLVARMLWSKGVGEFVEAAREFKKWNENVRFLLVGSPDDQNPESISEDVLRQWSADNVVEWHEHTDDVRSLYAETNVAVLPSYREGMPKSLLEAMACRLPIITTNARGCDDLVHDLSNGLKVPVKSVDALLLAMKKCYLDQELCCEMGRQGRRDVENLYSLNIINSEVVQIYTEILRNF